MRRTRTRWRLARCFSEFRRRALWITTPRQTRIRWHGRRPLRVGAELRVLCTEHLDGRLEVRLGVPGSSLLLGEPLVGHELTNCRMVRVVEVSDDGTEAEVRPTLSKRTRGSARVQGENT